MSEHNPKPILSSIVCIAKNYAIGKDNGMIWHLPADLKHFKRTTMGKPILMGRKSYESLGKPLPGRPNIVVSRSYASLPENTPTSIFKDMESVDGGEARIVNEGPFLFDTLDGGIAAMMKMGQDMGVNEVFITGGGQVYAKTLPITDRLYITVLDRDYDAEVFFPKFDWNEWNITAQETHPAEPDHNRPGFTFFTLERK